MKVYWTQIQKSCNNNCLTAFIKFKKKIITNIKRDKNYDAKILSNFDIGHVPHLHPKLPFALVEIFVFWSIYLGCCCLIIAASCSFEQNINFFEDRCEGFGSGVLKLVFGFREWQSLVGLESAVAVCSCITDFEKAEGDRSSGGKQMTGVWISVKVATTSSFFFFGNEPGTSDEEKQQFAGSIYLRPNASTRPCWIKSWKGSSSFRRRYSAGHYSSAMPSSITPSALLTWRRLPEFCPTFKRTIRGAATVNATR